jgi:hypothetical protein
VLKEKSKCRKHFNTVALNVECGGNVMQSAMQVALSAIYAGQKQMCVSVVGLECS